MPSKLRFTAEADAQLVQLKRVDEKKLKKVRKALGLMEANLQHPGLCVHRFDSLTGPNKEKVWEAYVENQTPGAYRILFYHGPQRGELTVMTITPHP
jgi:hypothetical protein